MNRKLRIEKRKGSEQDVKNGDKEGSGQEALNGEEEGK